MKKELSEMFALGAITLTQLIQGCDSFKDLKESLEYAEDYGKAYDRWCHSMQQKEEEKESSWKEFTAHYEDIDLMFEQMDRMWEREDNSLNPPSTYKFAVWRNNELSSIITDSDLQAAFDIWEKDRKKDIRRLGKEARAKKISLETVYRFLRDYNLTSAERTVFFLAYYAGV